MEANWRKNYLRYKQFFLSTITQYRERSDWRAYLEILLSLGTISIFSVFALKPTVITIAGLIKQIDEKSATVQRMDNKIQNLSKAQILYDRERSNVTLLEQTVIPKSANADIFARQVEGLSAKHQVTTSNFSIGEADLVGKTPVATPTTTGNTDGVLGASTTGFSITVNSGIDQYQLLTNYLADFKNLRRPPKIERVGFISGENAQDGVINLTLSITGQIPYLPD